MMQYVVVPRGAVARLTRDVEEEGLAAYSSSADTVINPSLSVVNTKRAGVLMVSAHACCFTAMVPI